MFFSRTIIAAGRQKNTVSPTIVHISSGNKYSIAANTNTTASVNTTSGTMLLVAFAQESKTANSNPAINLVTSPGLTFIKLASHIGSGYSGLANAHSVEIWGAKVSSTVANVVITWQYNTAIDDATYFFENVTNFSDVAFDSVYAVDSQQTITYSAPMYSAAFGIAACPTSAQPGTLTGFTLLANQNNSGASYWEDSSTSYLPVGTTSISNSAVSQAASATSYPIIIIGIILGS